MKDQLMYLGLGLYAGLPRGWEDLAYFSAGILIYCLAWLHGRSGSRINAAWEIFVSKPLDRWAHKRLLRREFNSHFLEIRADNSTIVSIPFGRENVHQRLTGFDQQGRPIHFDVLISAFPR